MADFNDDNRQDLANVGSDIARGAGKVAEGAADKIKGMTRKAGSGTASIMKNAGNAMLGFGKTLLKSAGPAALFGAGGAALTLIVSLNYVDVKGILPVDGNKTILEYDYTGKYYYPAQVLGDIFYQHYADMSYYFSLSEPDETAKSEELERYSGKAYNESNASSSDTFMPLDGEEDKGLTQASYENYVQDIDNYEENVKLTSGFLAALDQNLNGSGTRGYYYPEQFIKMVYVGDSCDPSNGEHWDASECELGNILEAESKKYESKDGSMYVSPTHSNEKSTADYGLGAAVHYQAYFEPSRINDYHMTTVCYLDKEWTYDGGEGSPRKCKTWSSIDDANKAYTLEMNMSAHSGSTNQFYENGDSEGQLSDGAYANYLGIYDVSEQIFYKNWAKAYYGSKENEQKKQAQGNPYLKIEWTDWAKSDPLVSTGVLDTNIVYVIDKATTYFGDVEFKTIQDWTTLGKATHSQQSSMLKNYTAAAEPDFNEDAKFNQYEGTKTLYRIEDTSPYQKGPKDIVLGFATSVPEWHEWEEEGCQPKFDWIDTYTSADLAYICSDKVGAGRQYSSMESCTRAEQVTKQVSYACKTVKGGYWQFDLYRDKNGKLAGGSTKIQMNYDSSYPSKIYEDDPGWSSWRVEADAGKNGRYHAWRAQPSYEVSITAQTKGDLQAFLVSHYDIFIESDKESQDYITEYVKNYKAYIPAEQDANYECYEHATGNEFTNINTAKGISGCNGETYTFATNTPTEHNQNRILMETVGHTEITDTHYEKILEVLGIDDEREKGDVEYNEKSLSIQDYNIEPTVAELTLIEDQYKESLETWYGAYGIDRNLIVAMIYASNLFDYPYIWHDVSIGDKIWEVKNMSNQINKNQWITRQKLSTESHGDALIKNMEIKMQVLMEKYNGNVMLALLEYSCGSDFVKKVTDIYEEQTGITLDTLKDVDKYDTGWFHFIDEAVKQGAHRNEPFDPEWIRTVLQNVQSSRVIWNRMDDLDEETRASMHLVTDENSKIGEAKTIEITTIYWNKFSMHDTLDKNRTGADVRTETRSALYNLRKHHEEGYQAYWPLLTLNQKNWESGRYVDEEHNYNLDSLYPTRAKEVQKEFSELGAETVIKNALGRDGDVKYSDIDIKSKDYWLSRFGTLKIRPDYKNIIGDDLRSVNGEYETLYVPGWNSDEDDEAGVYSDGWVIMMEPGTEFTPLTKGTVIAVTEDKIVMQVDDETLVTYIGLDNIEVELRDDEPKVLGTISDKELHTAYKGTNKEVQWGIVEIQVQQGDEFYDMHDFMDQYILEIALGSDEFFLLGGYWGSWCLLSAGEAMDRYKQIADYKKNYGLGGGYDMYQCTTYSNYRLALAINTCGGGGAHGFTIDGNGKDKVKRILDCDEPVIKNHVQDMKTELPCDGTTYTDIIFEYNSGEYGHTGYIESFTCDPKTKAVTAVISHSNGLRHTLAENNLRTDDEWWNLFKGNSSWHFAQLKGMDKDCLDKIRPSSPIVSYANGQCTAVDAASSSSSSQSNSHQGVNVRPTSH